MNSKLLTVTFGGALIAAVAIGIPALAADGNLVDLSIQTEMHVEGMSSLPPHTSERKVCMQATRLEAQDLLTHRLASGCKVTNYKIDGKLVTFDVMCTKPESRIHGEFHLTDAANFIGKVHSEANAEGHAMSMDAIYTGTKVGTCDYVPPKD